MRERMLLIVKFLVLTCVAGSSSLLRGEPLPKKLPADGEIPILIRISKDFFEELAQDEIALSLPVNRSVNGISVTGTADGRGRVNIELQATSGTAEFTLSVRGTAAATFQADSGPATVHASTYAEFDIRRLCYFDGTKFELGAPTILSNNVTSIDQICSRRGGCIGRVIRHVAWRLINQQKCEIDSIVHQATAEMISSAFEERTNELIASLNETSEFEKTTSKYFPETESWIYHLATRESYLLAGAGAEHAVFPHLPDGVTSEVAAPIEVWIRTTPLQEAADFVAGRLESCPRHTIASREFVVCLSRNR